MDSPRRRWFRFSLRTLLLVIALLALPLGWFTNRLRQAEQQRDAVAKLRAMAFLVQYEWDRMDAQTVERGESWCGTKSPIVPIGKPQPTWARARLGDDFFDQVVNVDSLAGYFGNEDHAADAEALRLVQCLRDLRKLSLVSHEGVDDSNLPLLASLTDLRELNLSNTRIQGDGLACLAGMSALENLQLWRSSLTDAAFVHLASLRSLKQLDMGETEISGVQLERLNDLAKLEILDLHMTNVQLADLGKLRLPRLKSLAAWGLGGDRGPPAGALSPQLFDGIPQLEVLSIRGRNAQPGLMEAIARLSNLRELDLSSASITDAELERIDQLRNLQKLHLERTKISDNGLRSLSRLPELTELWLDAPSSDGPLTERGYGELQRARPKLAIFPTSSDVFARPTRFVLPAEVYSAPKP